MPLAKIRSANRAEIIGETELGLTGRPEQKLFRLMKDSGTPANLCRMCFNGFMCS